MPQTRSKAKDSAIQTWSSRSRNTLEPLQALPYLTTGAKKNSSMKGGRKPVSKKNLPTVNKTAFLADMAHSRLL